MRTLPRFWMIGLLSLVLIAPVGAQEWTRFRGPNGSGHGQATVPTTFTEKDFVWKVEIPGVGFSSPVLWGEKVFVTSADPKNGTRIVLCIDAKNGKTLWSQHYPATTYHTHLRNSYATSTPTVDAERLYLLWATPEQLTALALDHDGKLLWQSDLGGYRSQHGFGVSPILLDGKLIINNDMDGNGSLIALDGRTGKEVWNVPRRGKNATYSTPCVYQPAGSAAQLIFTNWQHGITSIDPATGKTNWEISVFEPSKPERAIASPVVAGDLILGTCGFVTAQKHFVAVRPPTPGMAEAKPQEAWRLERQVSYLPTPLVKGDRVFLCSERGVASCLNLKTGEVIWQERVPGANYSASPILIDDRIFCISNEGDVLVLRAADQFEILGRSSLGDGTQSTPALANDRMYIRTNGHLIALGGKK
ncbi:MAG: PQQ-binding-like beta-propeller repeat protein [Gemmataceae bacterium]